MQQSPKFFLNASESDTRRRAVPAGVGINPQLVAKFLCAVRGWQSIVVKKCSQVEFVSRTILGPVAAQPERSQCTTLSRLCKPPEPHLGIVIQVRTLLTGQFTEQPAEIEFPRALVPPLRVLLLPKLMLDEIAVKEREFKFVVSHIAKRGLANFRVEPRRLGAIALFSPPRHFLSSAT